MVKRFQQLEEEKPKYGRLKSILITCISLVVIMLASELVVESALFISESLNISAKLISMVLIVIGTSLPELVTSVVAVRKGESDIAVGNVIGSNIFNIFFILGTSATILPMKHLDASYVFDLLVLIIVLFIMLISTRKDNARINNHMRTFMRGKDGQSLEDSMETICFPCEMECFFPRRNSWEQHVLRYRKTYCCLKMKTSGNNAFLTRNGLLPTKPKENGPFLCETFRLHLKP